MAIQTGGAKIGSIGGGYSPMSLQAPASPMNPQMFGDQLADIEGISMGMKLAEQAMHMAKVANEWNDQRLVVPLQRDAQIASLKAYSQRLGATPEEAALDSTGRGAFSGVRPLTPEEREAQSARAAYYRNKSLGEVDAEEADMYEDVFIDRETGRPARLDENGLPLLGVEPPAEGGPRSATRSRARSAGVPPEEDELPERDELDFDPDTGESLEDVPFDELEEEGGGERYPEEEQLDREFKYINGRPKREAAAAAPPAEAPAQRRPIPAPSPRLRQAAQPEAPAAGEERVVTPRFFTQRRMVARPTYTPEGEVLGYQHGKRFIKAEPDAGSEQQQLYDAEMARKAAKYSIPPGEYQSKEEWHEAVKVAETNDAAQKSEEAVRRLTMRAGKLTDAQFKSGLYLNSMLNAERDIRKFSDAELTASWNRLSKMTPKEFQPEKLQEVDRALYEWGINYLRQTTGAAITVGEFLIPPKSFVPAPGDTPNVVEAKRRARSNFMEGVSRLMQGAYHKSFGYTEGETVEDMLKRQPDFSQQQGGGSGQRTLVRSMEEYKNLPVGTLIVDPQGNTGTRKPLPGE